MEYNLHKKRLEIITCDDRYYEGDFVCFVEIQDLKFIQLFIRGHEFLINVNHITMIKDLS